MFKNNFFKISLIVLFLAKNICSFAQVSLHQQFKTIAEAINGKVGVYATVIETGDTASYNGDSKFPMQSVYKFPIAMAILDKVDKGQLRFDQKIHVLKSDMITNGHSPIKEKDPNGNVDYTLAELLYYNVGESDGSACDVLLRILGGTKNADTYVHTLGIKDMAIATTEKVQQGKDDMIQYKNWATPAAITQLLKIFYTGNKLSPKSKAYLLKLMVESSPGPKRIKGLLPQGTVVAHKTGTSGTTGTLTRSTNDVGIITLPNGKHLAITVFVSDSNENQEQRELTIAKIARAAYDFWNK